MFRLLSLAAAALLASSVAASAAVTEFVPPNDPVGKVFTTNSNDGYDVGRGVGFQVSGPTTVNSVGIFHDLTNISPSYGLHELDFFGNGFTRTSTLRSGSANVTTSGLEWIDFSFADVVLTAGKTYLLEFSHNGSGNQNFFYFNDNVMWSQGGFSMLDGTHGTSVSNTVVAAFRVSEEAAVVPLPAGLPLLLLGLGAVGMAGRRRKS